MLNVALRPRLAVVLLAGALAASLTACGGKEAASAPPPVAQSSTTPSSSPTPTTTPTPNGAGGKYGDLTLVVRRPAKTKANTTAALASFQSMHESFAAMLAGQKTPAELSDVATPDLISRLSALLDSQRKLKEHGGGTLTIRVTEAQASRQVAVVEACFDQSKLVTIRPNGSRYVDATVKEDPTMVIRATVTSLLGKWKVTEYTLNGGTC
jgi:hypothetical protein